MNIKSFGFLICKSDFTYFWKQLIILEIFSLLQVQSKPDKRIYSMIDVLREGSMR